MAAIPDHNTENPTAPLPTNICEQHRQRRCQRQPCIRDQTGAEKANQIASCD
jgi:hypothetical protein